MLRSVSILALSLLAACSFRSTPVRLQGDAVSIAWLGGAWNGEYWGATSGRRGNLAFYLPSGTDSLAGDVMMQDAAGMQLQPADPPVVHRMHVHSPQLLRVDLVVAYRDSIRGVLEPYIAPDCRCTVSTTFTGQVTGNEIEGIFETRSSSALLAVGRWRVTRTGTTPH
jgi:hypothetical protein